jgi:hypothetical protein
VSEKLNYEVIGDFKKDKNYLEYTTVEECIVAVDKLYNNHDLIEIMECENKKYYKEYARPDKQIEHVLNIINSR